MKESKRYKWRLAKLRMSTIIVTEMVPYNYIVVQYKKKDCPLDNGWLDFKRCSSISEASQEMDKCVESDNNDYNTYEYSNI